MTDDEGSISTKYDKNDVRVNKRFNGEWMKMSIGFEKCILSVGNERRVKICFLEKDENVIMRSFKIAI